VLEKQHSLRKQPGALMTNWPIVSARHAGRLGDHPTPVGSAATICTIVLELVEHKSSRTSPFAFHRMPRIDVWLIRPQFPSRSALGYLSQIANHQLMG